MQTRLYQRSRHLIGRGIIKPKVTVALARELCGFIWALLRQVRLASPFFYRKNHSRSLAITAGRRQSTGTGRAGPRTMTSRSAPRLNLPPRLSLERAGKTHLYTVDTQTDEDQHAHAFIP